MVNAIALNSLLERLELSISVVYHYCPIEYYSNLKKALHSLRRAFFVKHIYAMFTLADSGNTSLFLYFYTVSCFQLSSISGCR